MKYLLIAVIAICIFLVNSCSKTNHANMHSTIIGSWELRYVEGGYRIANYDPNYPPGNGDRWEFTGSICQRYIKGELRLTSIYQLQRDSTVSFERFRINLFGGLNSYEALYYEPGAPAIYRQVGVLGADGFVATYVKVSD